MALVAGPAVGALNIREDTVVLAAGVVSPGMDWWSSVTTERAATGSGLGSFGRAGGEGLASGFLVDLAATEGWATGCAAGRGFAADSCSFLMGAGLGG